jgi:hypothetical protein
MSLAGKPTSEKVNAVLGKWNGGHAKVGHYRICSTKNARHLAGITFGKAF